MWLLHRKIRLLSLGWATAIVVVSLVPSSGGAIGWNLDKVGHFLAYAGLGLLACLSFEDRRSRLAALAGAVMLGSLLEVAQNFVPGRDMSALDELADIAGVLTGALIFRSRESALRRLAEQRLRLGAQAHNESE